MLYYIPYHAPIHPGRVFSTFIAVGVAIEVITANGAARIASSGSTQHDQSIGKALLKAALIMQIALMVAFAALAAKFQLNCSRGGVLNSKIKRCLIVLYTSSVLITIRTIFRTVEYFSAASLNAYTDIENISPLLKQEWFFWFFEAVFMYCNSTMLNVFHPMQVLPHNNKIYLTEDGETEIEGPGYKDTRPFLLTLVDPFDIYGIIVHKGKKERFWEKTEAQQVTATHSPEDA